MKIVSVMTTGARGGAEVMAQNLLEALAQRGHETTLVTNRPELAESSRVAVRVRRLDLGPKLSLRNYRALALRAPLLVRRLRAALAAEAPFDVLLLHFKKEQLLALALPRRLVGCLVWAEWGPVPFQFRHGLANRLFRTAAGRTALVLAVSEGTRKSLVDAGVPEERVVVVPSAQPTDRVRFSEAGRRRVRDELGIPDDAFVVGCLSRFHAKKRNDVLVEAVKQLADSTHLILAGEGEAEGELRRLAAPLGPRAHFVPSPVDAVAETLSAFDVSVFCPSPTEGAPGAVILSMLVGRPIVASAREGVTDIIVPGVGAIAEPDNDVEALAALLRDYAGAPERIVREGRAGRLRAETLYAAPTVAANVESLFEGVLPSVERGGDRS